MGGKEKIVNGWNLTIINSFQPFKMPMLNGFHKDVSKMIDHLLHDFIGILHDSSIIQFSLRNDKMRGAT